ncbi:MAG: hypothetical protein IRY99_12940 [Isosphaeraceae bacterium]|nr:hypothetical protein [Isosphaeraceae bacterium]
MWTCPKCGAKVDPSFDVCWQCGTSREGVEDPSFVPADQAEPIPDPPVVPELNVATAPGEAVPGAAEDQMVECYQAISLMEAQFLANKLNEEGIPAVADTQDFQDALGTWDGNPRVYCRARDLDRARAWLRDYDTRRKAEPGRHLEP